MMSLNKESTQFHRTNMTDQGFLDVGRTNMTEAVYALE